jgi:hypothetical protein
MYFFLSEEKGRDKKFFQFGVEGCIRGLVFMETEGGGVRGRQGRKVPWEKQHQGTEPAYKRRNSKRA